MLAGDKLGRYELKGLLGSGGMAQVWEAVDGLLGRCVAVKVIRDENIDDPEFRARFQREARLIASLEHESILPVFDFGTQDDVAFLVMPLVSGGSLKERLKRPVSP